MTREELNVATEYIEMDLERNKKYDQDEDYNDIFDLECDMHWQAIDMAHLIIKVNNRICEKCVHHLHKGEYENDECSKHNIEASSDFYCGDFEPKIRKDKN
jgi:hypothetical protein